MNDVTSSMINVFRALLADDELQRIGELMKALEGRPESETEPLWDFYMDYWVNWFLKEYEPQLTRARHPLKLVATDRANNGYVIELYESRFEPVGEFRLNTVAQIFVHSEDAAIRLQSALYFRLEKMAPSPYTVPELAVDGEKGVFVCPKCGSTLRPCDDVYCLHCDECDLVTSHFEMMQRGAQP